MHDDAATPGDLTPTGHEPAPTDPPVPVNGQRTFHQVLANTALANITTSFLWFALTFWVYLETRSVLATGIIGGAYMLLVAVFSMFFGTLVDRYRKHKVMLTSGVGTLVAFSLGGLLYLAVPSSTLLDITRPWFWLFTVIILIGAVVEQLRNLALSTTVTLLVPASRRANANGLVGTVQGMAFMITSVFSGLAIGTLGMGWTIAIAITVMALAFVHLMTLRIPEPEIVQDPEHKAIDFRGGFLAVRAAPGLLALIIFTTFNNLTGGVFMALMDPYGLELFSPQIWGIVLGVTTTGFLIGGALIARFGLGKNPIRTMLIMVMLMGALGATFTIREYWWLFALGIWLWMMMMPAVEAAEQTIIQRVVPFRTQGRVFGFAMTFEAASAPITSFLVAPIAEFIVIPYMNAPEGQQTWGWLVGTGGTTRGIAMVFLIAGIASILLGAGAFLSRSYRLLSRQYKELAAKDEADASGPHAAGQHEPAAAEAAPVEPTGEVADGRDNGTEQVPVPHS
ncbi:MFS transporter [Propionibacteriaceae bacterium Y2011]